MPRACVYKKKKSALRKLVHCPTERQGTWQTLPLILLLCRWLLPSFLQLNSSLGKCSPRGIQLPEKAGKEVAAGRSWSYPANHPCWLLCCRNMEAIPIPLLNMNMHHTTTSKIGLLLFRTTKVFLYIIAAKSYGGAHTLPTAPHESSIYLCWCLLESIAQMPWKGRFCDLFGSLSEQQATCHQWYLFVTKLLSPFQTIDSSQIFTESRWGNGAYY